jgi:hypothetical protein
MAASVSFNARIRRRQMSEKGRFLPFANVKAQKRMHDHSAQQIENVDVRSAKRTKCLLPLILIKA